MLCISVQMWSSFTSAPIPSSQSNIPISDTQYGVWGETGVSVETHIDLYPFQTAILGQTQNFQHRTDPGSYPFHNAHVYWVTAESTQQQPGIFSVLCMAPIKPCMLPGLNCRVIRPGLFFVDPFTPRPNLSRGGGVKGV